MALLCIKLMLVVIVGTCVAATKSGSAGRSQATGNPGGARNTSLSQTIENDSKASCTNDWCLSEVSKDDEHKAQSAGKMKLFCVHMYIHHH